MCDMLFGLVQIEYLTEHTRTHQCTHSHISRKLLLLLLLLYYDVCFEAYMHGNRDNILFHIQFIEQLSQKLKVGHQNSLVGKEIGRRGCFIKMRKKNRSKYLFYIRVSNRVRIIYIEMPSLHSFLTKKIYSSRFCVDNSTLSF